METERSGQHRRSGRKKYEYAFGMFLLLLVVALWTSASFLMNSIFVDQDWDKPFLTTYICTSTFTLYLFRPITSHLIRMERWKTLHRKFRGYRHRPKGYGALPTDDDDIQEVGSRRNRSPSPTTTSRARSISPLRPRLASSRSSNIGKPSSLRDSSPTSRPISPSTRERRPISASSSSNPDSLLPPLTTTQTVHLALIFCFLWFAANWASNSSLAFTTVSSSTILVNTSGLFTLVIGSLFNVEKFTMVRLGSVLASVVGVVLVSKSDQEVTPASTEPPSPSHSSTSPLVPLNNSILELNGVGEPSFHQVSSSSSATGTSDPSDTFEGPSNPLLGDLLALLSALVYASYVILLKTRIRHESRISPTLFFGFVGLFNIILLLPFIPILHLTELEIFELPHGKKLWASIGINAGITFISDLLYLRAMLLTSPLAVTLGLSLTIPLAVIGDLAKGTPIGGWMFFLGGGMVVAGFVAVGISDNREERGKRVLDVDEDESPLLGESSNT